VTKTWTKELLKKIFYACAIKSLHLVNRKEGRHKTIEKIVSIVPDISDQYSTWTINPSSIYDVVKIRSIHAFQVNLALTALRGLCNPSIEDPLFVVDIGDSSGTHTKYLQELCPELGIGDVEFLSVNLDSAAVEKILAKGGSAIQSRAEDLHQIIGGQRHPDVYLSFQSLEHFFDPISFLRDLAVETSTENFVITVPYMKRSRVGLKHLRNPNPSGRFREINAENTHIFELSPEDWKLIFRFSGWMPVHEEVFFMTPSRHPLSLFRYALRRYDFEGFYGVILRKSLQESELYRDW
jgi:hypothetical protein